ncbi:sensor histidine kinase [Methanolobus psychrotolerans]|uniref:sensor histidine kinase n=1 Tax=Methanolobus psychrotolerans TaxID=1874706 RepID=UPI000B91BB12|nr:ATP-binding protein [Methanolobus psychrotolerans]
MKNTVNGLIANFDNFSIRTQLIFNVVGIILILGVLMGSYLNVVQTNMMKTELNEKGISITRNLAENSVNPILTDNQVRLQWLVETIKKSEPDVVYVFIIDENGEAIVHTFKGGFPTDLKGINPAIGITSTLLLDTEIGSVRDISYPILDGKAGEVHVGMSQESIRSTVDKFTVSLALFVLLLMIVGSTVAYIAGSVVSRPIIELKEGVKIFGEGNLDHKVSIQSRNEIGQLATSFNDMAEHLGYLIKAKEKATKEILDTRNYLTKILSGSLDGIIVADHMGKIEFINEAFIQIAESGKDQIIGCDIYSFLKEKDEDMKSFFNRQDNSNATFVHELNFITPAGKLKSVILSMGSVEYRNEIKYVAVVKDITEIKKLEQTKSNIISNISHELRTPLNIMKGYVEIAIDEQSDDRRNGYLQKSLKALERQNWMIQDLLEVARSEGEIENISLMKTNVNNVVEMACKLLNGKLQSSGIDVVTKPAVDRFVMADPEKLTYALTKLIENALKFTDKGGYVEIGTSMDDEGTVIYVKDTGTGIPKEHQVHIFDKFYQVDGSSTRKYGGNGLGLAIAKNIIDQHKGKLWVESEPGKGSTFFIKVPYFADKSL